MRTQFVILGMALMVVATCAAAPQDPAQPAAPATIQAGAGDWIMVLPFNSSGTSKNAWIGKAIQQNVFTDLIQRTRAHVAAPQSEPPAGAAEALRAARDGKMSLVVFGDIQESGADIRITGQVLDVASGNVVGGLKATGPADNLFTLEDAVALQVLHDLPAGLVREQPRPVAQPMQQPTQPVPEYYSPPTYSPPPTYNEYSTTYYYDTPGYGYGPYYGYPYYSSPYIGFGGVFLFNNGFHNRGFGEHRDFGGSAFRSGFGGSFGAHNFGRSGVGGFRGSVGGAAHGGGRR